MVKKKKPSESACALLVTTEHKGVFFGYGKYRLGSQSVQLKKARMCIYWSSDLHGVLGLASSGPSESCRIGPAVPELVLEGVTSVTKVSKEAVKNWEAKPWG